MRLPENLVPQKAVAQDLCVSPLTLWRARRSGIPGFPQPVVFRNMLCWRKADLQALEDALLRYDGRCKFEARQAHAKLVAQLIKQRDRAKPVRRAKCRNARQEAFF